MIERMKQLVNILNKASELYYNGRPSFLSDEEFDRMFKELQKLERETKTTLSNSPTVNVGSRVLSTVNTITIEDRPMLSLNKVHSAKEVVDFGGGYDLISSIKCDGLSVRLKYIDGELKSANTRGDGYEGADITEHVKHFLNIPLHINKIGTYIADGEAVILSKDFDEINRFQIEKGLEPFANSRNLASGSLALLDMSIVDSRKLTFILWDVIKGSDYKELHYRFEEAKSLGFTIVPSFIIDATKVEEKEIEENNEHLFCIAKENGIPCDGIVYKINNLEEGEKLGKTARFFLNAVAFKRVDEEVETELLDIVLSMGRTGVLTPVAIFKPVQLEDSEIERASLHNVSVMRGVLGDNPSKGQKIWVCKKNQIIPQVTRAEVFRIVNDEDLIFPKDEYQVCPVCGEPLKVSESESGVLNFICPNPQCNGKLITKLDHYLGIKGLNVKGLSRMTLSKLIEWGWLDNIIDIYSLKEHRTEWIKKPGFGIASVDKILSAIEESKKDVNLASFISALGIPLIGNTVAKQITKYYVTWTDFRNAIGGDWTTFNGFGYEMNKAINNFDYREADLIAAELTFKDELSELIESIPSLEGLVFCTTGKLKNFTRNALKDDIEKNGGKLVSSISSKVNYLITNTPDSGTKKNLDAQKAGVKIITEEQYLKLKL